MKTLRFILLAAAAMILVATCDDESMNMDKTRISADVDYDYLYVYPTPTTYILQWSQPKYKTDHGKTVLSDGSSDEQVEYEVWLKKENGDSVLVCHTIVETGEDAGKDAGKVYNYTAVTIDKLNGLLDSTKNFQFGIKPVKMTIGNNNIFYQTNHTVVVVVVVADSIKGKEIISCWGGGFVSSDVMNDGNYNYYTYISDVGYDTEYIHLEASVLEGYEFKMWSDGKKESYRQQDTVKGNVRLEAEYEKIKTDEGGKKYQLTVNVTPQGCGEVEVEGNNGEEGDVYEFSEGETATLKAVETSDDYVFNYWTYKSKETDEETYTTLNPYSFPINGNVTLTAHFKEGFRMKHFYSAPNEWYIDSYEELGTDGTVNNDNSRKMIISIDGNSESYNKIKTETGTWSLGPWVENICCKFSLPGQEKDYPFYLTFDIDWEGEDTDKKEVYYRVFLLDPKGLDFNDSRYSFVQDNKITLENGRGSSSFEWEGTINDDGVYNGIGIQLGFAGIGDGDKFVPNGKGTFTISNMKVLIDGNEKW